MFIIIIHAKFSIWSHFGTSEMLNPYRLAIIIIFYMHIWRIARAVAPTPASQAMAGPVFSSYLGSLTPTPTVLSH